MAWLPRDARYGEKLATPDVTIADLIGEVDPVRIAEGRYLADEEAIHFGLIPRTHRGIFAINELPDLTEKVQVGLFNVMEERDLQIKGYKVRLPLDVLVVATANPEDYTSRGRIVTPLKDRFDVQIRTHYPRRIEEEIAIMEQEVSTADRAGRPVRVPGFLREIVARITFEARAAPEISQSSGVSVRASINNYETLIANAEKRALRCREAEIVPRLTDLPSLSASTGGKIELDYGGDSLAEGALVERVVNRAVKATFDSYVDVEKLVEHRRVHRPRLGRRGLRQHAGGRLHERHRDGAGVARRHRSARSLRESGLDGERRRADPRRPASARKARSRARGRSRDLQGLRGLRCASSTRAGRDRVARGSIPTASSRA